MLDLLERIQRLERDLEDLDVDVQVTVSVDLFPVDVENPEKGLGRDLEEGLDG